MKKLYTLLFVAVAFCANAQVNLVTNGDFETWTAGLPAGWFTTGSTVAQSTTDFHGGASSIGCTAPATGNKTITPSPDIAVTATATYVFSGWYLDNVTTAQFKYWNQFRTATADTGANPLQSTTFSTDSAQWQFFTTEGVPNATATVARPGLRVYPATGTTGGGVIFFDDVSFYDKATLAVNVNEFESQVKIPTLISNSLIIETPTRATVNIYTLEGKLFSSNRVNSNEAIDTQALATGIYVITVQNDFAKTSKKIIKQ